MQPVGSGAIFRINPVAKLAAAAVIGIALVLSIDIVSASIALGCELALLGCAGLSPRQLAARTWPIALAAALGAVTILLYGTPSGDTHLRFLSAAVTDGSIALAVATLLRVLAIGLPAVVLFVTVDPTDLADGLAQVLRLPARFVVGALGGMRLIGLLVDDWQTMELARRARGIADGGRMRRFGGLAFALLVIAIRRGSALATAMEARGFGGPVARTWARESRMRLADLGVIALGTAIAGVAVAVSVSVGAWNPVVIG